MNYLFPYDNVVVGILIITVGFIFHWVGQLISIINWDFATKIGLQESNLPKEYKVYEHAIAATDTILGLLYGLAGIGLLLNLSWGYKLTWFPGAILIYHSLNYWYWTKNRNRDGIKLESNLMRVVWTLVNFVTGVLAISVAWNAN